VDTAALQRFSRHVALPEIGLEGQERLAAARVAVAGADLAAEVIARYLAAAGVGTLRLVGGGDVAWPADGAAWVAALAGVDLCVRSGFDDDAMLGAAKRLGIPVVVVRGREATVDLISFPRRAPDAGAPIDAHRAGAEPPHGGAAAVVAGTLAAAEALHVLAAKRVPGAGARMLRLPLDGGPPQVQYIPWEVTSR
jgi:hypothetical protein